ncbi:MAG: peptidylprolyl isomerase [Deltaproteobacteria bacterium]|nr:MAG: peptidylprolyl isomerase [Deltaproteobacteria bacterium]
MSGPKIGDRVKVHYTGKLEDGRVFDSSRKREPIEFVIGEGEVIQGFEDGVVGMEVGASKTITIPPEEAYGPRIEQLVVDVKKEDFPPHINPAVGQHLQIKQQDGNFVNVTITDIAGDTVTLDANHPLAGYTLIFEIELVEVIS